MNKYYEEFLKALKGGSVERRTNTATGDEAIYQNGNIIISNCKNSFTPDLTETVKAEPHLILFGSGHIAKALYDLAALQHMKITVLDDREELLTEERFPYAERYIAPFAELLGREYAAIAPYYIIFTHGHSYDTDCLRYALSHPASYIGMIGSKAKSEKALKEMIEEGFDEGKVRSVHSPIGLKIGAETPEEIAVSIMAEIVSTFRSEKHFSTLNPELLRVMAAEEGIEVRIIEKKGSAPRAVGSLMFVTSERIYGTIGGGAIEQQAIQEARSMKDPFMTKEYNLTTSGDLGMVCGGEETLLFRKTGGNA